MWKPETGEGSYDELKGDEAPSKKSKFSNYVDLTWKDVSLKIGDKQILDKVSGSCFHGELSAILGVSGKVL